jgi:signal peptidase I
MYPALLPEDRLLVLRCWSSKWLHTGQIVVGDLGKVLEALEKTSSGSSLSRQENEIRAGLEQIQDPNQGPSLSIGRQDSIPSLEQRYLEKTSPSVSRLIEPPPTKFIKRLTGLPGDTISIRISELDQRLRVILPAKYATHDVLVWHIPPGHCFVRGDGQFSGDSVIWGPIPIKFLTGLVLLKLRSNQVISKGNHRQ